jgi:hypothetical protein
MRLIKEHPWRIGIMHKALLSVEYASPGGHTWNTRERVSGLAALMCVRRNIPMSTMARELVFISTAMVSTRVKRIRKEEARRAYCALQDKEKRWGTSPGEKTSKGVWYLYYLAKSVVEAKPYYGKEYHEHRAKAGERYYLGAE